MAGSDLNRSRNGTIDFLRFLCCVIIVICHASEISLISKEHQFISRGSLCVEFFFIVSGYLMVCSADKRRSVPGLTDKVGTATSSYILIKVKSLMPNLAVAYVLAMAAICLSRYGLSLRLSLRFFAGEIYKPILFSTGGFGSMSEIWYICFMLLVMMVLYPILIKHFDLFIRVIAPLIAVFLLGWIAATQNSLVNPVKYLGYFHKGLVRAFGEIALGASLYPLISYIKKKKLAPSAKIEITVLQVIFWGGAVFLMTLNDKYYDFFVLLLITLAVVLAFSHQGFLANKMDNRINGMLGKLSLTVYLSHRWIAVTLGNLYPMFIKRGLFGFTGNEPADVKIMWILYLSSAVVSCAAVYIISLLIKKVTPRVSGKLKNLLKAKG